MADYEGPFHGTNLVLRVKIYLTWYIVGVVEGCDFDFGFEGGPESIFGQRAKRHSMGSKRIPFTITRWYYTDTDQEDLLLDLFKAETSFELEGYLINNEGVQISKTAIVMKDCKIYGWKPRTGSADDIIGEEARGFATDWDFSNFDKSGVLTP